MSDDGIDSAADRAPTAAQRDEDQTKRRVALIIGAVIVALLIWWVVSHIAAVPSTVGMSANRASNLLRFAGFETSMTLVPTDENRAGASSFKRLLAASTSRGGRSVSRSVRALVGAIADGRVSFDINYGTDALDLPLPAATAEAMPTDAEEVPALYTPPKTWDDLMPDVQNMKKSSAISTLKASGLTVTTRSGPSTTDVAKGRVYYQKPAPGLEITSGEEALLWISTVRSTWPIRPASRTRGPRAYCPRTSASPPPVRRALIQLESLAHARVALQHSPSLFGG